jgi:hypothetical protein
LLLPSFLFVALPILYIEHVHVKFDVQAYKQTCLDGAFVNDLTLYIVPIEWG